VRALHEEAKSRHRPRVEHDSRTLLIHLSDEAGRSWTTIAVDRATRRLACARGPHQAEAARQAYEELYRR
jgi:hypothetical protein